jgi:hypothetical protein
MKTILAAFLAALSLPAYAAATYDAPTGSQSPLSLAVTMYLADGGPAVYNPHVTCGYYGCTQGMPTFSLMLPDGTTFNGTASETGTVTDCHTMHYDGTATDSSGAVISFEYGIYTFCRSGRGGGCTRRYLGGWVTVN